eukprot:COSAG06_NODE_10057_length_1760_cov_2.202288_3_plen_103_part_01
MQCLPGKCAASSLGRDRRPIVRTIALAVLVVPAECNATVALAVLLLEATESRAVPLHYAFTFEWFNQRPYVYPYWIKKSVFAGWQSLTGTLRATYMYTYRVSN